MVGQILDALGGNGKSVIMDAGLLFGDDPYHYPDNLPVVNATGGPGGRPSCGSLPDVSKNFPVKYLVTDTGVRFAIHDDDAAHDLGLPAPIPAPWPVLVTLPSGPELSRQTASVARDTVAGPP